MTTRYPLTISFILSLWIALTPITSAEQDGTTLTIDAPKSGGEKWVFLIGIEDYYDNNIIDLRYSVDDVRALYDVLADPERGGFNHLQMLTSEETDPQKRPTRRNIFRGLRNWLSQTKPNDTVLFYFSGHGMADKDGQNYLIAADTEIDLPQETAVSMRQVNDILNDREQTPAKRIIVVLDSCHSGVRRDARAFAVQGQILNPLFEDSEGRITLASCGVDEQSYEDETLGRGVFTHFFVEGLKGSADQSQDGLVTASELNSYVYTQVTSWAKSRQLKQTPRKQENISGEFVLASNPRRLAELRQLETQKRAELQAKTEKLFGFMGVRVAQLTPAEIAVAVKILQRVAAGETLPDVEMRHLLLIEDLVEGKIDVLFYKEALQRLPISEPTRIEPENHSESTEADEAKQAVKDAQSALDAADLAGGRLHAPKSFQDVEHFIRNARFLLAQRLFSQAKTSAQKAEDLAKQIHQQALATKARKAIEQAEIKLAEAERANAPLHATAAYQNAKTAIEQAEVALKAERYDEALQRAKEAENIAHEAYTTAVAVHEMVGKDGAPMVLILAGQFLMGSKTGLNDEKPVHEVYLDAYYIDKYEATVGRYRKFIEATGHQPPDWDEVKKYSPTDNHPMVLVSWHDAMAYAKWAGKTLPTEAQWEKAARGGLVQKNYPNGDSISHEEANYVRGESLGLNTGRTAPVNRYPPNGYGLHNMAGNVWEWCLDHYDKKYYSRSPKQNPVYLDEKKPNKDRVVRGGSFNNDNFDDHVLRCAYRNRFDPSRRDIALGFRCVVRQ